MEVITLNSNFSKNLTSSMGISLGGLEVVTDFLFTNPEFYESDLADVKNNIFGQNVVKQHYEKPVKPKKTKEAIMHKFSILQYTPVIQSDEVLESPILVGDDTDFDFDFTEEKQNTVDNIEDDSEVLEANSLMQRLSSMNNFNESIIEDTDIEIENDEYNDNDIDIETDDDIEIEEDITEAEDDDFEIEDSDFEIEDNDFEVEDDEIEPDDSNDFEIEDEDIEIEDEDTFSDDELQIIDNFENDFTPSTINSTNNSNNKSYEEDEIDLDFEDDTEDETIDEEDKAIDEEIDSINLDDIDTDEDTESEKKITLNNNTNNNPNNEELKQMQQRFTEMEKQLQELKSGVTKEQASNIKDNVNKVSDTDNIDKLLDSHKKTKSSTNIDKYERYNLMSIEALYNEVKAYMIKMGVKARAVELVALNEKFGELNIRKLIQKSYLIKIGSKGVTVGR